MKKLFLIALIYITSINLYASDFERFYSDSNNMVIDFYNNGSYMLIHSSFYSYGFWKKANGEIVLTDTLQKTYTSECYKSDILEAIRNCDSYMKICNCFLEHKIKDSITYIDQKDSKTLWICGVRFSTYNKKMIKLTRVVSNCWNGAGGFYYVNCSVDSNRLQIFKKYGLKPKKGTYFNYIKYDFFCFLKKRRINHQLGPNWEYYLITDQMVSDWLLYNNYNDSPQ